MRRLNKELVKAGILFETDELDIVLHGAIDTCSRLVEITQDFIITVVYSAVLDPVIYLYDRKTFDFVGEQYLYPERSFGSGSRTWGSYCKVD